MKIPSAALSDTIVFDTKSWLEAEEFGVKMMPSLKFLITQSRTVTKRRALDGGAEALLTKPFSMRH